MTDALVEQSDYFARRQSIAKWNVEKCGIEKGYCRRHQSSSVFFTLTHLNQAGALVHVYQTAHMYEPWRNRKWGRGYFKKSKVAASELGLDMDRVKITATDTAKVPTPLLQRQAQGDLNGMAVKLACEEIRHLEWLIFWEAITKWMQMR